MIELVTTMIVMLPLGLLLGWVLSKFSEMCIKERKESEQRGQ